MKILTVQTTIYFLTTIFLLLVQSSSGQTRNDTLVKPEKTVPRLHATLPGGETSVFTVTEPGFKIISFRMSAYEKGVKPIEIDAQGNRLTPAMQEILAHLHKGAKVYFEYIKAVNIAGGDTVFTVEPMALTIK